MRFLSLVLIGFVWPAFAAGASPSPAPFSSRIPDTFGVNIHFTHPEPGEMEMIAALGIKWVRMDLAWDSVEREKGRYDFSAYDHLAAALEKNGLKALFILDYGNSLYDGGLAPHSPEGRAAFSRFATAAIDHYRGKGFLWEIWNEPNLDRFWRPKAKAEAYVALAGEVTRAVKAALPGEALIGPATSHLPEGFLKKVVRSDFFPLWSGITVHPYRRGKAPESVQGDYAGLRKTLAKNVTGEAPPILSGEWGYSNRFSGLNDEKQGMFLARMWLVNLAQGVPLSIWYDWRNGPNPKEKEDNFGLVRHAYRPEARPVLEPKPAYEAARALIRNLEGFQFLERVQQGGKDLFLLAFEKGGERRYAAWTTGKAKMALLKVPEGPYRLVDYRGMELGNFTAEPNGLSVRIDGAPRYLIGR